MTNPKIITEGETGGIAAISVSAPKLRRMLTAVLPHVSRDDTLPALTAVKFEVDAGVLYLAATDRYTIAVAREKIPGAREAMSAFALPAEGAWSLRRMLKGAGDVAALSVADGLLSVDCGGGTSATWAVGTKWAFPKWRPMFHRMVTADRCEMGDDFGLDPYMLERFAAGKRSWAEPLNVRVTRGGTAEMASPVLMVTRGDWFIGAQMPARMNRERHRGADGQAPAAADAWAAWTAATAPEQKPEAA